jgi:NDP-sugar pyrophosphorylase family protein
MISVFILCGGKNSRIKKYNKNIIKPLIVYKKKTLLEHHVSRIKKVELDLSKNIFINVGNNYLKFKKLIKKKNISIKIIREKKTLGTAGVIISNIEKFNDNILIFYGDNYLNVNIKRFIDFFFKKNCDLLIGVYLKKDLSESGRVYFDSKNLIKKIEEKKFRNKNITNYCNSGLYLIRKSLLKNLKKNIFTDFSNEVLPIIIKKNNSYVYKIGFCKAFDDEKNYRKNIYT